MHYFRLCHSLSTVNTLTHISFTFNSKHTYTCILTSRALWTEPSDTNNSAYSFCSMVGEKQLKKNTINICNKSVLVHVYVCGSYHATSSHGDPWLLGYGLANSKHRTFGVVPHPMPCIYVHFSEMYKIPQLLKPLLECLHFRILECSVIDSMKSEQGYFLFCLSSIGLVVEYPLFVTQPSCILSIPTPTFMVWSFSSALGHWLGYCWEISSNLCQ